MTPREWILKCYATEAAASQRREDTRQPKPIGCSAKKIFGAAKARPVGWWKR